MKQQYNPPPNCRWNYAIWLIKCPRKCKKIMWLILTNHILVWDFLMKKIWVRTGRCFIFNESDNSIKHLFLSCIFTKHVWDHIFYMKRIQFNWSSINVSEVLSPWFRDPLCKYFKEMAVIIIWNLWKDRNLAIFEDWMLCSFICASKIIVVNNFLF